MPLNSVNTLEEMESKLERTPRQKQNRGYFIYFGETGASVGEEPRADETNALSEQKQCDIKQGCSWCSWHGEQKYLPMRCEVIICFGEHNHNCHGWRGWYEHVVGPRSSFRWGRKTLPKPQLGNGLESMYQTYESSQFD